MPLVNIILPVFNRPLHTKQAIESLYQNTDTKLFSLIVVNDGSNEETTKLIADLSNQHGFMFVLNKKSMGPGYSRNKGAQLHTNLGRGRYIYHCDNDVFYQKGWLETLLACYREASKQRVALLGASCHPYQQNNDTIDLIETPGFTVGIKNAVSGYSQLMNWEIWDRFGEFVTQEGLDKKTGRSDDWEYCQRIIKSGLLVGSVEPELIIPCGKTDSYGDPAVGQETFKDHDGVLVS